MFDEVTKRKSAARRVIFVFGAIILQAAIFGMVLHIHIARNTREYSSKRVEVKFLKALSQNPLPSSTSPPCPSPAPLAQKKLQTNNPKKGIAKSHPLQALVQPKEISLEMKVEQNPPESENLESKDGVAGGDPNAPSSVPISVADGVAPVPPSTAQPVEDVPANASKGFRKPQMAEPGCVQQSIRIADELIEHLGLVTVKFAIDKNGVPSRFQTTNQGLKEQISQAIWRAVQSCRWIPGANAQGQPVAIWVVLPIKFSLE